MTVDKRIRDARVPANDRDAVVVTCSCGATMTANVGRRFGEPSYLWWACTDNPNHVTRAIPLPGVLAMRSMR